MDKFSVICCSTGRKDSFSLVEECMMRQTLLPEKFIIVGENLCGYDFNLNNELVINRVGVNELAGIGDPVSTRHSYCDNFLLAMQKVESKYVLVWEDDDWYHDQYNAEMMRHLEYSNMVGISHECYYFLRDRKLEICNNTTCATLSTTGFDYERCGEMFCEQALVGHPCIDTPCWSKSRHSKKLILNQHVGGVWHIGFKQLYPVACTNHNDTANAQMDKNFKWLRANCSEALDWIDLVTVDGALHDKEDRGLVNCQYSDS